MEGSAPPSSSSPPDRQPPAVGATSFGPVIGIVLAAEDEVLKALSTDIGVAMGLKALSIGCGPEEDAALHACYGYDEGATTPEKKEACDKAADTLRKCLEHKVDIVKAIAAWARGDEDCPAGPASTEASVP